MISCKLMTGFLLVQLVCADGSWADARWIEGTYRNPALGYSVKIPPGLKGKAGDEAGPERGVGIPLPSGGTVTVYGEPNSLEWKSPADGVRFALTRQDSACRQHGVIQTRVGKLSGAKANLVCGDHVMTVILVFRPGGEPVYWLRLETIAAHESEDSAILERVAASFKLIRWE